MISVIGFNPLDNFRNVSLKPISTTYMNTCRLIIPKNVSVRGRHCRSYPYLSLKCVRRLQSWQPVMPRDATLGAVAQRQYVPALLPRFASRVSWNGTPDFQGFPQSGFLAFPVKIKTPSILLLSKTYPVKPNILLTAWNIQKTKIRDNLSNPRQSAIQTKKNPVNPINPGSDNEHRECQHWLLRALRVICDSDN